MPQAYVEKLAKKHKMSIDAAEKKWEAAKRAAEKQGHAEDYDYITSIFKNMMGESIDLRPTFSTFLKEDFKYKEVGKLLSSKTSEDEKLRILSKLTGIERPTVSDLRAYIAKVKQRVQDEETRDQQEAKGLN